MISDLDNYRNSEQEKARTADLVRLLPPGRSSALDIGARDGFFSRLLTEYFETVTAFGLEIPAFTCPRVINVAAVPHDSRFPTLPLTASSALRCWSIYQLRRMPAVRLPEWRDTRLSSTCRTSRTLASGALPACNVGNPIRHGGTSINLTNVDLRNYFAGRASQRRHLWGP